MDNLDSSFFTYANMNIIIIKRMLKKGNPIHKNYTDADIVNLGLDVLRVLCEIVIGNDDNIYDEWEWDAFFESQKTRDGFDKFINGVYINGCAKNSLLNQICRSSTGDDVKSLVDNYKKVLINNGF